MHRWWIARTYSIKDYKNSLSKSFINISSVWFTATISSFAAKGHEFISRVCIFLNKEILYWEVCYWEWEISLSYKYTECWGQLQCQKKQLKKQSSLNTSSIQGRNWIPIIYSQAYKTSYYGIKLTTKTFRMKFRLPNLFWHSNIHERNFSQLILQHLSSVVIQPAQ